MVNKFESRQEKANERAEILAREKKEEVVQKPVVKETKKSTQIKKPQVKEISGRAEYANVSTKILVEVLRYIRNKPVKKAQRLLTEAMELKKPIPYKRYTQNVPHRKGDGFGPGRYPVKVCKEVLNVLKNAVANAQYLELDADNLYIKEAVGNRAVSMNRGGRHSHIKITVAEMKEKVNK